MYHNIKQALAKFPAFGGMTVKFSQNCEIASGRLRCTHRYDPRNDGTSASHSSLRA
jgi:hypothetical protein